MNLSELIYFHSNRNRLEKLKENRRNIVPFVGAGISKGCGLYTWEELLHQLAIDYLTIEEIQTAEANKDFLAYADKIVSAAGNSNIIMRRIREIFTQSKITMTEIPFLLVSMFSPMIITTNYDTLLERASNTSPLGPLKALLPCLVGQMNEAIQINDRRLLKIHGSIEETPSFIFTSEQYRKFYGEKNKRKDKLLSGYLMNIFSGKKVLFIGCSLEKDYTLEILEECVQQNHNITHYGILPCPADPLIRIQRNSVLAKLGIEPIYYPEGDYQAINKLLHFIAEENHFIHLIKEILIKNLGDDKENALQIQVLLSVLRESYYKTAILFPELLDIDNANIDYAEIISSNLDRYRQQTDTIMSLCKNIFGVYIKYGCLRYEKETIDYFSEQFGRISIKESIIEHLLQQKWSMKRYFSQTLPDSLLWLENLSNGEVNHFASDILKKLQYANGMSYDLHNAYYTAKKLIELAEERIIFDIRVRLLNSIGAFGYSFQDSQTAIDCLERAIQAIDMYGNNSRDYMLLKAKCYANLAITKGYSGYDLRSVLDAVESDVFLKKKYNETPILYCRSLNFYATVLKEIHPFQACDIYIEVANIKEDIINNEKNSERIQELTASWATTVFNIGLLAKDLELYDLAYRIIQYANDYRFKVVDTCNKDYCSSINVFAELELFVEKKQNIQWLIRSIESRINLPKGFTKTLAHTWYICAYYYYLKKDYSTAIKYINKSIQVSMEKGVFFDFRQNIRTKLLLADIKYAQEESMHNESLEAASIVVDIIDQIRAIYGSDSYYLILPCRHLLQMTTGIKEVSKYKHIYSELIRKYTSEVKISKQKMEEYIMRYDDK
ncbi:MAG: hypothetical protein HFG20_11510 [Anaerotruncus sp.]|nr:hypothetical protein [Anaerotruncus sp.]